jgi:hypothetical protein
MNARAAALVSALFADELLDVRAATAATSACATGFRDLIAALGAFADHRPNRSVIHLHAVTNDHRLGGSRPLMLQAAADMKLADRS